MSIDRLTKELNLRKGYVNNGKLKKGKAWLANHYNVSVSDIEEALDNIRNNVTKSEVKMATPIVKTKIQPTNTKISGGTSKTFWVAGCLHMPFHNKKQFNATLNYLKTIKVDGIILAGDILDLNSLSFHDKGKVPMEGVTLATEYTQARKEMEKIYSLVNYHQMLPENLHFMYGNHEDRYLRTLKQVDGYKLSSALQSPESALQLEEHGFNVYRDYSRDTIELGDLVINHGEYLNQHVAKKTIEVYKQSSLFFHTHRFQIYADGAFVGYNMGFGGDITSPVFNYAPRGMKSSWTNASALVTVTDNVAHVQPLMFRNNKLVVNGVTYSNSN